MEGARNSLKIISRRRFTKMASVSLIGTLTLGLPDSANAQGRDRQFTDSLGRKVKVPSQVDRVMPLGDIAQCLVCTLCPEALASIVSEISSTDEHDLLMAGAGEIARLPNTGGGSSGGMEGVEPQSAKKVGADIMLDVGLSRDGLGNELDALQSQEGVPCIFLDASFGGLPQAYRLLGELLGRQQRAEELACFVEKAMSRVRALREEVVKPCSLFYAPRRLGLEVKDSVAVQINAVSYVGARPVVAPYDFSNRIIDLEKVDSENPDLIVFDDTSSLASLIAHEGAAWDAWQSVKAVENQRIAVSPALIYSWFGSLVHVQAIGILWLASVLWPSRCSYDIKTEAQSFYHLFYGREINQGELERLLGTYWKGGYLVEE